MKHLIIPDVQATPGVDFSHLEWIGKYIVEKQPDHIICLGDFADMESLSYYDKGKKRAEGKRYCNDIKAAGEAMDLLLGPMREYNKRMKKTRHKQYKPKMTLTLGNHEDRIRRATENDPELHGTLSWKDLPYKDWNVHPFLEPVLIDGICYSHFMANPMTGKPLGGQTSLVLKNVGRSFIVGHTQKLDVATRHLLTGEQQWGIIAGACYTHDEDYKGPQGNHHWRGIIMAHRVINGSFDPMFISLDYLKDRYER